MMSYYIQIGIYFRRPLSSCPLDLPGGRYRISIGSSLFLLNNGIEPGRWARYRVYLTIKINTIWLNSLGQSNKPIECGNWVNCRCKSRRWRTIKTSTDKLKKEVHTRWGSLTLTVQYLRLKQSEPWQFFFFDIYTYGRVRGRQTEVKSKTLFKRFVLLLTCFCSKFLHLLW